MVSAEVILPGCPIHACAAVGSTMALLLQGVLLLQHSFSSCSLQVQDSFLNENIYTHGRLLLHVFCKMLTSVHCTFLENSL